MEGRNPYTRVSYDARTTRLFRSGKTGRWARPGRRNPAKNPPTQTEINVMLMAVAEAGAAGIPSGHLYAAFMGRGWSLDDYQGALNLVKSLGLVKEAGFLLTPTEELRAALAAAKAKMGNPISKDEWGKGAGKVYQASHLKRFDFTPEDVRSAFSRKLSPEEITELYGGPEGYAKGIRKEHATIMSRLSKKGVIPPQASFGASGDLLDYIRSQGWAPPAAVARAGAALEKRQLTDAEKKALRAWWKKNPPQGLYSRIRSLLSAIAPGYKISIKEVRFSDFARGNGYFVYGIPGAKKDEARLAFEPLNKILEDGAGGKIIVPKDNPPRTRELSVPERHQLKVARDTLRMPDAIAAVMGGPTKEEAREIIFRLTGKREKENPPRKAPRSGLPEIYAGTDSITMQKGPRSNWPGQKFVHKFSSKPKQFGVGRGATITMPDGRTFKVDTASVLLTGKKDLYKTFSYPGGKRA